MGLGRFQGEMSFEGFARNDTDTIVMEFTVNNFGNPNVSRTILMTRDQLENAARVSTNLRGQGYDGGVGIDADGKLGGAYLLPEDQLTAAVSSYNARFHDTKIEVSSPTATAPATRAPVVGGPSP